MPSVLLTLVLLMLLRNGWRLAIFKETSQTGVHIRQSDDEP